MPFALPMNGDDPGRATTAPALAFDLSDPAPPARQDDTWSDSDPTDGDPASEADLRDPLTGLGNRHNLNQAIDQALKTSAPSDTNALLMIDLDRFKNINETLGHAVGDVLLRLVARRLHQSTSGTERIFRPGGDEFAVLLRNGAGAGGLAARLVDILARPYLIEGKVANIGASIGVATTALNDGTAASLVRHASLALRSAKAAGRRRWHAFEPLMAQRADARHDLEMDLRKALKMGEFRLVYQAQMNIQARAVTGFEALLRWHHPTRGLVPPDIFIPIAEEIGAIVAIGEWVLRTACAEAVNWPGNPVIAVNVSPLQFEDRDRLLATVQRALSTSGLAPDRLELEITESALLRQDHGILETLHRLRGLGIRIAMDDFGTGYSSLSQLMAFPFDKIKIDQSFVRGSAAGAGGTAVVRAIAALGASLDMSVIAEGVETAEQASMVQTNGCTDMQGYLISKPISGDQVLEMLRTSTPGSSLGKNSGVMEKPYQLIYCSRNRITQDNDTFADEVTAILARARRNNQAIGVTGALLFTRFWFAQVLEGPRDAVEMIFERIQSDPRHGDVTVLSFLPAEQRSFPDWSMAFAGGPTEAVTEALDRIVPLSSRIETLTAAGQDVLRLLESVVQDECMRVSV